MGDTKVIQIPVKDVPSVFTGVKHLIQNVLDVSRGETNIELVYKELLVDRKQLFIITDDRYLTKGACVTELIQYCNHKNLRVVFLGGNEMSRWLTDLDAELVRFAKREQCREIEVIGRKGWIRKLEKMNYRPSYYQLYKEV